MKRFYYFLFALLSLSTVMLAMAFVNAKKERPDKHLEIVLRTIGHRLLLHSKDSTSRVLPIQTVNENTFRISFENSFGFTPDTLMNLVHQQLALTDRPGDYIVSVNKCDQNQTVFAYEVNSSSGDLKPCKGRELKKGCYNIEITFLEKKSINYAWLFLALVPFALMGFYFVRLRKKPLTERQNVETDKEKENLPVGSEGDAQALGSKKMGGFEFDETKGLLRLNGQTIELSGKEIKAVSLFVSNPDVLLGRDTLMKEIWEDDGVFVISRNVDVLVSKLRKKLSVDPTVRIVNVHGKGYKLVTR